MRVRQVCAAAVAVGLSSPAIADAGVRSFATPAPVNCSIPKPCAMFTNTGDGAALEGASASGAGLFGTSSSGVYYEPGVDGESSDSDGEDAGGAFGTNVLTSGVAPQYGVIAYGNGIGLAGEGNSAGTSLSNSAYGVFGQDSTGTDSQAGDYNVGVVGASTVGTALLGETNGSPSDRYFGHVPIGVYSVAEGSQTYPASYDYYGETNSSEGYGIYLRNFGSNSQASVLGPAYLINLVGSGGSFHVDTAGNAVLSGQLTTSKSTYVRSTGESGTARTEYSERATAPELEDVGEGQLANGRAYVSIDPGLADSMDRRTTYHVFVTPDGDCNQLYVARRSAAGFEIRESHGGRSTLAFEYRIVAKPRDENGARLAIAPALKAADDGLAAGRPSRRIPPPPLSPQERLKRRMGTQAYAQAMLGLRARRVKTP